eukprot:CAMPEP_0181063072 /NCGR_PEP_ID=MMETSP1070-20121207/23433_1 /TAXON_ID=265543 /ORGANISM="Minutocellus polymorphus, Strain NH13" /LENGTH=50 /DNA_ID=CAMNT_0023143217 /DNA_START=15 /DNA_END=164 /DNA_ORIENTATION=+
MVRRGRSRGRGRGDRSAIDHAPMAASEDRGYSEAGTYTGPTTTTTTTNNN